MGALVLSVRKYGSCRLKLITQSVGALAFKRSKVWELPLYTSTSVGAPVLSVQKCGSSRLKRPKVWGFHLECPKCGSTRVKHSKVGELSFETTRSVGALALNA